MRVVLSVFFLGLGLISFGQSFQLKEGGTGNDITGVTTTFTLDNSTIDNWFSQSFLFFAVNVSGVAVEVKSKRIELSVLSGSEHYMGLTTAVLAPMNSGADAVFPEIGDGAYLNSTLVNSGDSILSLNGFYPRNNVGSMCIRHVIFDANNPLDSAFTDICFDLVTELDEVKKEGAFSIYPNPVQDKLTVSFENPQDANYEVYNVWGGLVESGRLTNSTISTVNYLPGIYVLTIFSRGSSSSVRFIKE